MNKTCIVGVAALLTGLVVSPASADGTLGRGTVPPKHVSNTLQKMGDAIQYPFRKAGENMSIDTHRAEGDNSVVKDERHRSTDVVQPDGDSVVITKDNPRIGWTVGNHSGGYMHRRHRNFHQNGRKYYWFEAHRYYYDQQSDERVMID
ncbi:MAG: hypothetical protein ACLQVD_08565 [Capsulimonadaceae bacterium]